MQPAHGAIRAGQHGHNEPEQNEGEFIQRFFDGIEKLTPQLVNWNGGGFDLPVLHYCGMIHSVSAPLDDLAKLGMDGSKVWEAFRAGKMEEIRDYCETDVMNTYLVLNRFCRMRGELTAEEEAAEIAFIKARLAEIGAPHWQEFLAAWV